MADQTDKRYWEQQRKFLFHFIILIWSRLKRSESMPGEAWRLEGYCLLAGIRLSLQNLQEIYRNYSMREAFKNMPKLSAGFSQYVYLTAVT